jgi:hypothetical protein
MAKTPPMPITPDHDRYGICGQRPRPMDNRWYPRFRPGDPAEDPQPLPYAETRTS